MGTDMHECFDPQVVFCVGGASKCVTPHAQVVTDIHECYDLQEVPGVAQDVADAACCITGGLLLFGAAFGAAPCLTAGVIGCLPGHGAILYLPSGLRLQLART